jgi:hypothetical protein
LPKNWKSILKKRLKKVKSIREHIFFFTFEIFYVTEHQTGAAQIGNQAEERDCLLSRGR